MKRTRYDAEYERVRRETEAKQRGAAAPAPQAPAEPRRRSPREEERQRVQAIADDVRARHEALEADLRERERVDSAASAERAREFNERAIRAAYAARGLSPKNEEWRRTRDEQPEAWAKAIEFDQAIRAGSVSSRGEWFLHRKLKPLGEVDLSSAADRGQVEFGFLEECEGMCGI